MDHLTGNDTVCLYLGEVAHPAQQAICDPWGTSATAGEFACAFVFDVDAENTGGTGDDGGEFRIGIKFKAGDDAETVPEGGREEPGAGSGAYQGEFREVQLYGPGARSLADDDVQLEVLHGRIEDLFDHVGKAVDLIDEQHIMGFKIGKDSSQITGPFDDRS